MRSPAKEGVNKPRNEKCPSLQAAGGSIAVTCEFLACKDPVNATPESLSSSQTSNVLLLLFNDRTTNFHAIDLEFGSFDIVLWNKRRRWKQEPVRTKSS
jgi:hypothetical protein